jgi:hypothetical protein
MTDSDGEDGTEDSDDEDGTEDRNDLTHTECIAWPYSALSQPTLRIYGGRAGGGHSVHTILTGYVCTQDFIKWGFLTK